MLPADVAALERQAEARITLNSQALPDCSGRFPQFTIFVHERRCKMRCLAKLSVLLFTFALGSALLTAFPAVAAAEPPVPTPRAVQVIRITMRNDFLLEGHRVFVNGIYRGVLGAAATANLFVNVGSFVQVAPTVSRGCDFVADQPGLWVVYPISWGQAAVRYEGS